MHEPLAAASGYYENTAFQFPDTLGYLQHQSVRHGMNTAIISEPRIVSLDFTEDSICAQLADGRTISVPLAWSWRLSEATPEQRKNFELIGSGEGVHWPDIDEDISAKGMLQGIPAHRQIGSANFSR